MTEHSLKPITPGGRLGGESGGGSSSGHTLSLDHLIDAPRTHVWKTWISEEYWQRCFEGGNMQLLDARFDVREGGSYRYGILSLGIEVWLHGDYLSIIEPERTVSTCVWENGDDPNETTVAVDLIDLNGQTRMVLQQYPFRTMTVHDLYGEVWTYAFETLARSFPK